MAMFELSEERAAEWKLQLIEQVQPHVNGEQVLALAPFRRGGFGAQMAISKAGGGIAYAARPLFSRKRSPSVTGRDCE